MSTATRVTLPRLAPRQVQDLGEFVGRRASGVGGLGQARAPGQRAVQADLLAHDLADAADALADVVLAHAGEVQPHRRAAAAVEERGAAGHEGDVLLQRAGQQVGGVDVVGQRRPEEQPALRVGPLGLAREVLGQRVEHRVAPAAVDLAQRVHVLQPAALARSTSATKSWVIDDEHRSTPCLPRFIFSITGAGATAQPRRIPGERIFENVPR